MDLSFTYREYPPPESLRQYVKSFWVFEPTTSAPAELRFSPIPDGFPGMIFQLGEQPAFHDTGKNPMPPVFVFRSSLTRRQMLLSGDITTLGVYFYPSAIRTVFGFDAKEMAEDCLGFDLICPKDYQTLIDDLRPLQNPQRVLRLAQYFGKRIEENTADSRLVDIAVSKILQAKGQVQLPELLKTLAVSERSLERHFKQYIGINPNAYIRLCRFHAALQDVRNLSYDNLTGIAYAYGYADQSHFIREFKKFSGISPLKFLKNEAEALSDLQVFSSTDR